MVGDRGGVGLGIVLGQVADAAEVVGQRPEDIARRQQTVHLLVGKDLVNGRAPEVTVAEVTGIRVAAAGLVELERDLVAVVDEDRAPLGSPIAVGVQNLPHPAVAEVVRILDDPVRRPALGGVVRHRGEPVAVVPLVRGHVRVRRAGDVPLRAVPLGVVLVGVRPVGGHPVVGPDRVAVVGAVAVLVVDVVLVGLVVVGGVGQLVGVVVGVVGRAAFAHQRREVEVGHAPGHVVEPVVVGERGGALAVRQVRQPAGLVEEPVGLGHQLGARQVGVAPEILGLPGQIKVELEVFLRHGVAARLTLLPDPIDPAEVVVDGRSTSEATTELLSISQEAGSEMLTQPLLSHHNPGQSLSRLAPAPTAGGLFPQNPPPRRS